MPIDGGQARGCCCDLMKPRIVNMIAQASSDAETNTHTAIASFTNGGVSLSHARSGLCISANA
jgi:hypothetical protein